MEPFSLAAALSSLFSSIGPAQLAMFAGSQLASSLMQDRAARKVNDARTATMAAERQRQNSIDASRSAQIQGILPQFTPDAQKAQQASIAERLGGYLTPTESVALKGEYTNTNPGAPTVIQDGISGKLAEALSKGKDYAKNMATMSAYGMNNFQNSLDLNRVGERVGELNRSSAASSGIVPLELDNAGRAGRGWSTAADITSGLGQLALLYGNGAKKPALAGDLGTGIKIGAPGAGGINPSAGGAGGIRMPFTL